MPIEQLLLLNRRARIVLNRERPDGLRYIVMEAMRNDTGI